MRGRGREEEEEEQEEQEEEEEEEEDGAPRVLPGCPTQSPALINN